MNLRLDTDLRREPREPFMHWTLTVRVVLLVGALLIALATVCRAQGFRLRPSRPIPPPSAVESFTFLIYRSAYPQALHIVATWQQPDGETSVYHHNQYIPSSGLGPGDHVVTEVDVPAFADLVPVALPDCNGGCGPSCAQFIDIVLDQHVCDCRVYTLAVAVPGWTANLAEPFMVAYQSRRVTVAIRDQATGKLLEPVKVHDPWFTWQEIGVSAPIQHRRAAR